MKKIISILLAVMLVVSIAAVSFTAAVSYPYSDSYTVDRNTPYTEEAIVACGGNLDETQTLYFQAPEDWLNEFNTFPGPDDDEPYAHICIYWWDGIGSEWPDGTGVKWVGYQAHLVDKANRIYAATVPSDGATAMVVWNNGVNAGMDKEAPNFKFGRQLADANVEGAFPGELDTLPEGSPDCDNWNFDGCIQIINYDESRAKENSLTGFLNYDSDWYVYYGEGCYGNYPMNSANFKSRIKNCVNKDPKHDHSILGDVNGDEEVTTYDMVCIQYYLADHPDLKNSGFNAKFADIDKDGTVTVIDASRIQRYLAKMCELDGSKYKG